MQLSLRSVVISLALVNRLVFSSGIIGCMHEI